MQIIISYIFKSSYHIIEAMGINHHSSDFAFSIFLLNKKFRSSITKVTCRLVVGCFTLRNDTCHLLEILNYIFSELFFEVVGANFLAGHGSSHSRYSDAFKVENCHKTILFCFSLQKSSALLLLKSHNHHCFCVQNTL